MINFIKIDSIFSYYSNIQYARRKDNEFDLKQLIRTKIKNRVKTLSPGKKVNAFIAVRSVNWEKVALVDTWSDIANVYHYDWGQDFDQYSKNWHTSDKYIFNDQLIDIIKKEHQINNFNIFFSYLSGRWVFPETIKKIGDMGIITINIGFDDTQSFWGDKELTGWSGNAEIAPFYDICITSQNENDIAKYITVGATPIFLPPAGNPQIFGIDEPKNIRQIDMSFIGQKYGQREYFINYLRKKGLNIVTKGIGWPEGQATHSEMREIYQNSLVTLGFGFIGAGGKVGLKGRDFEVPFSGCAYLTSYNPELANFFEEDKEIVFYRNKKELYEKAYYLISNPNLAIKIGLAGMTRAKKNHTWQKRWEKVMEVCFN